MSGTDSPTRIHSASGDETLGDDPPEAPGEATRPLPPSEQQALEEDVLGRSLGPGECLGPYRVLRFLAEGGMGRVFLAQDATGRPIALKVLRFTDDALRQRFEREGDVLEKLDHPNLVRLMGRGIDERTDLLYLALEYVPGRDLGTLLSRCPGGRLSLSEGLFVVDRCAQGLDAVHATGVLHRDIKPSNVLVTRDGQVKLSDFGLALAKDISVRLTARNYIMGTLNYLAPELLGGEDWTAAGDMYSLGCLAFRVLTGRNPFKGSVPQILRAHRTEGPPSMRALVPDIPPEVEALVHRLLAKEPEDRPTAAGFLNELDALDFVEDTQRIALQWLRGQVGQGEPGQAPAPAADAGRAAPAAPAQVAPPPRPAAQQLDHSLGSTEDALDRSGDEVPLPRLGESTEEGGRFLGPYLLLSRLGRGAMGEVFLAWHPELKRQYAVKILAPELVEDASALQRFERETTSLAQVDLHPGIVRVHSAGVTPDGRPYFAMEYVHGESLKAAIRSGLTVGEGLAVIEQVAEALSFAHAKSLVHRDVKPENIILGEDGVARLADFGLAKITTPGAEAERLTRTGELLGTPTYMAPEQADIDLGPVGPWSDVFSLGAITYELYAGIPPYHGKTAIEVFTKLIEAAPLPPLPRDHPELSPELVEVIERALSREPGDRYCDAGAFLEDLRRVLHGAPASGRPSPVRLLVLVAAVSLVLGGLAVTVAALRGSDDAAQRVDAHKIDELLAAHQFRQAADVARQLASAAPSEAGRRRFEGRVVEALRRAAEARFEARDASGALDLLREAESLEGAGAAWSTAPWILAANGAFAEAVAAARTSGVAPRHVARLAAWAGDAASLQEALGQLKSARGRALAWELRAALPADAPQLTVTQPGEETAWRRIADAERDLARGCTGLAALAFAEAAGAALDDEARLAAWLGALRTAVARARPDEAVEAWLEAWPLAVDPLDRLRLVGWAAALSADADARPLARVLAPDPLRVAEAWTPGVPLVAEALHDQALARRWSGAGGSAVPRLPPTAALPVRAREAAREGRAAEAGALLAEAGAPPGASFTRAEEELMARGADGPAGLAVARGLALVAAAEVGRAAPAAERALEVLTRAAAPRPGSPSAWLGRARAALLLGRTDGALELVARAARCAPADPRVEAVRLRVLAARLAPEAHAADALRIAADLDDAQREDLRERDRRLADAWQAVASPEELRADLGLLPPQDPDVAELRLWRARALVERLRARVRAADLVPGEPQAVVGLAGSGPEEPVDFDVDDVNGLLEPLAPQERVAAVVQARRALADALLEGRLPAVTQAERRLADAAAALEAASGLQRRHLLGALLLRASVGLDGAAIYAQAYLALAADLPARALLHLRRAEAGAAEALDHARALAPREPALLLARELRALGVGQLGHGPEGLLSLARLVEARPEWLDPLLEALRADGGARSEEELAGLAAADAAPSTRALARSLGILAGAGADPGQRAAEAARAAAEAARGGAVVAHLLRARALSEGRRAGGTCDPRLAPEVEHALACATAAAPWSPATLRARLALEPDADRAGLAQRFLALGFVQEEVGATALLSEEARKVVRHGLSQVDLSDWTGQAAVANLLDQQEVPLPELSLALRLTAFVGARSDRALTEAQLEATVGPLALDDPLLAAGARSVFRRARSRRSGGDAARSAAATAALAALSSATVAALPPDVADQGSPYLLPAAPDEAPAAGRLLAQLQPAAPELTTTIGARVLSPAYHRYALFRAVRDDVRPPLLGPADLLEPWSRSALLLHGARHGIVQDELVDWCLDEERYGEALLALGRAAAFRWERDAVDVYVEQVYDQLWGEAWDAPTVEARRARWPALEGASRLGLALFPGDDAAQAGLAGTLADALLGRAEAAAGEERRALLEEAALLARRADPARIEESADDVPDTVFQHWRRVRALGLVGEGEGDVWRAAHAALLAKVRDESRSDRRFIAARALEDPLRELLLERAPAYAELLAECEEIQDDEGRRRRRR